MEETTLSWFRVSTYINTTTYTQEWSTSTNFTDSNDTKTNEGTIAYQDNNNGEIGSNVMWFEISIALFIVVGVFLVLLIVCFIRQKRLLKNALTNSSNRQSASLSHGGRKDKFYCNSEYNYENPEQEQPIVRPKQQTEDVGTQSFEFANPRQKNQNYESGFGSIEGSIIDRKRQDNIYEPDIIGPEWRVFTRNKESVFSNDQQTFFRSIDRKVNEEDVIKIESEVQMRDIEADVSSDVKISGVMVGTKEVHQRESVVININDGYGEPSSEDDYENCEHLHIDHLPTKQTKLEPEGHNLENPLYAMYSQDGSPDNRSSLSHDEELTDKSGDECDQPLYQNAAALGNAYLKEWQSRDEPAIKNFINFKWDYKAHVTQNGGLLKADNSDIKLCLPNKFVSTSAATIYWSIFAQDSEIKARSDLDKDLCVVSPVVEYYTPYDGNFDCYVVIELPHCISEHADNNVQPYWFDPTEISSGGIYQIRKIPCFDESQSQFSNFPDVFYLKKHPGFVSIYTLHFSVYFCACSQYFPLELYAVTFGKYVPIDNSQVNIKIKVHIADAKITLKDCLEALKQDEQTLGYYFKGKTEIDLEDDDKISGTDSIEIKVDFEDVPRNMNPVWKHSVDKKGSLIHPVTKQWHFGNRFKCGSHKFIQTTKEWQFKNESPPRCRTVFQCFIDIIYKKQILRKEETSTSDTYPAMTYPDVGSSLLLTSSSPPDMYETQIVARTRMTVDIDLSDTVIDTNFSENSMDSITSRRGILPSIIYEIIDGLDDERFDEMCRRLGAERELRCHRIGSETLGRGRKYDLLDSIRDVTSDGRFCKDILSVLTVMKENRLKQSIAEYIKKATHCSLQKSVSIDPQPYHLQTPRPGDENSEDDDFCAHQTHRKTLE